MNGNGSIGRRLDRLEAAVPVPETDGHEATDRLCERLATYAQGIHDSGAPLEDLPGESPAMRCVIAAMQDATEVGEWGSAEHNACFWKRVTRYAFAVHAANAHGQDLYQHAPVDQLLDVVARMRAMCDAEEGRDPRRERPEPRVRVAPDPPTARWDFLPPATEAAAEAAAASPDELDQPGEPDATPAAADVRLIEYDRAGAEPAAERGGWRTW